MGVLEKGGNAFDAAAAAGLTLQVVEPHLNGPLGEAPILVWSEKNRRCDMICGQGVAPQAATIARYREPRLDLVPGTGLLAATVPGAFDAWMRLLRDYGTLPLADILGPAISYAENGYPLAWRIRGDDRARSPNCSAGLAEFGRGLSAERRAAEPPARCSATRSSPRPTAACSPRPRRRRRPRAARSTAPATAWYRGFVAEAIDHFCRTRR